MIEARKFSGLAVDTLVELTKDNHADSTRYAAATALLDRGYGRPAQSLDLHLSADAITKRLSDMTDAELAALEATNDCRRTDCAGGNCGSAGRCGRATGRRRRGFPAGCPCLRPRLYSGFRPRPHSVSGQPANIRRATDHPLNASRH